MTNNISAEVLDMLLYGKIERHFDVLNLHNVTHGQDIPREVCILPSTVPGASQGVFSTTSIKPGTTMGPYHGNLVKPLNSCLATVDSCWELLNADGSIRAYLNAEHYHKNWMMHVQCARAEREQNLEVKQIDSQIYYRTTKEIKRGEELLVWYGCSYNLYMGLPVITISSDDPFKTVTETNEAGLPLRTDSKYRWRCVLCKRGFNSRSNLRSHMRIHTMEKPFVCRYCSRRFSQSSTLRNHVRLHTGQAHFVSKGGISFTIDYRPATPNVMPRRLTASEKVATNKPKEDHVHYTTEEREILAGLLRDDILEERRQKARLNDKHEDAAKRRVAIHNEADKDNKDTGD